MKKIIAAMAILALALGLGGCATQYYPDYAAGQAKAAQAAAKTNATVLQTISAALGSPDEGARVAGAMGLGIWLARHQPVQLEQARPSPIEEGIGKMIPSLPMWGAMYGMFTQSAKQGGGDTNVTQEVSGNGSGGVNLGAGSVTPSTSVALPVTE